MPADVTLDTVGPTHPMLPLARSFYEPGADEVAMALLGKYLVHRTTAGVHIGRIVETEAYLGPHDRAAHSARGRTARTEIMFGPPGFAYVYLIYGRYCCFNAVTGVIDHASAVLVRALEPVAGLTGSTRGPGLLCAAMGIDRRHTGSDLTASSLFIADAPALAARQIARRPRIGVDYAGAWARRLLRFYEKGNPNVSRR